MTGANMTGANMTGANMTGANMTGANMTGATDDRYGCACRDCRGWQFPAGKIRLAFGA
jgi:uncharacterized protein YjbI with pentapeptide repeats